MPIRSAALLVFRRRPSGPEFLLAHPGGPFWARKNEGAWTIPKGLVEEGEDPLAAALREFAEETGLAVEGNAVELAPVRQKAGKLILPWMIEADLDLSCFHSNTFEIEWPPRSGRRASFPEIDVVAYLDTLTATRKILPGQSPILDEALSKL